MVGEAVVPVLAQHNVVKHGDAEQLAAVIESTSQGAIFLAGSRIAARMVVRQDDGARVHEDEWLEDFAGMDDAQGEGSHAHGVDANDSMFRVQANNDEMLAIESIEERLKQPVRSLGIADPDVTASCSCFFHQHDAIAGRGVRTHVSSLRTKQQAVLRNRPEEMG